MPVLYTPEQLARGHVPTVHNLRQAPIFIQESLQAMLAEGDILGATSYGSLFMKDASVNCASDCDWLIVFSSTDRMLHSERWHALKAELERRQIGFHVPVISLEQIRTGNHTLCSLLHGIRSASRRLVTGDDPLMIFAQHGFEQNTVLTTLQLFSSFTRFFFEQYAHAYAPQQEQKVLLTLLDEAVCIWKDVLATMLVRSIGTRQTIPVRWDIYTSRFNGLISQGALDAGAKVAAFLEEVRRTMEEYDRLRHTGAELEGFAEDYGVFLEESLDIVPAAAHFAEANIRLYREWATPKRFRVPQKRASHLVSDAYNAR